MNKILTILIIIVSFLAGVFFMSQFGGCTKKETTCKERNLKDSTVITHTTVIDTVPFPYKKPTVTFRNNTSYDSTLYKECDTERITVMNITDSLIKGDVTTIVKNNQVKNVTFSYKPLFPKIINRTDTFRIKTTTTETIYEPYKQSIFYIGGSLGTNDIGVSASIKTKKDLIYGYKFGMTYQGLKTHNIEFKIPIFKSKHKTNK